MQFTSGKGSDVEIRNTESKDKFYLSRTEHKPCHCSSSIYYGEQDICSIYQEQHNQHWCRCVFELRVLISTVDRTRTYLRSKDQFRDKKDIKRHIKPISNPL